MERKDKMSKAVYMTLAQSNLLTFHEFSSLNEKSAVDYANEHRADCEPDTEDGETGFLEIETKTIPLDTPCEIEITSGEIRNRGLA